MKANLIGDRCHPENCSRTLRQDRGSERAGDLREGTWGKVGDVRLCDHGNLWEFVDDRALRVDVWRRVSRVFEPIKYRRARRALRNLPSGLTTAAPTPDPAASES